MHKNRSTSPFFSTLQDLPERMTNIYILNPLHMRIRMALLNICHTYGKKMRKSRFRDPTFGLFLVNSKLGSRDYTVKSAILIV